jgi:hypothetical protein
MGEKAPLKDFGAFEITMPTDEQHRAASLQWLQRCQPTLIDQWPAELMALSVPTKILPIDVDRAWEALCELYDGKGVSDFWKGLALALDYYIRWDRKFIRLNSRSPKDNMFPFEVPATVSGKEACMMLMGSMRVMDDLMQFRWVPEQPAYVAIRDFDHRIRPESEFRCFVKDGELIGVTHYDYTKPTPQWVSENVQEIRKSIDEYFAQKLKPVLHVDTVVFDLALVADKSFTMIEINPYGLSDPCHFGSYQRVENASSFIECGPPTPIKATEGKAA